MEDSRAEPEAHLAVLRLLEQHPHYSQRQLSTELGVSLGKTHYLLKALLDKGLLKVKNFQRSDRKLAYLYVLTPQGVRHRAQLTKTYLALKEAQFESLKQEIEQLRREQVQQGEQAVPPAASESPSA